MTVYHLDRHPDRTLDVVSWDGMTFAQCLEQLRDGRAYTFTTPNLAGYFYKAPHPADPAQTRVDGAVSAITYYHKKTHLPASPTLMLYDFDDDDAEWFIQVASAHPLLKKECGK